MAHTPSGHWIGYRGALMRRRKTVCGQCLLAIPPAPYQVLYPRCTSVSPTPSTRAGRRGSDGPMSFDRYLAAQQARLEESRCLPHFTELVEPVRRLYEGAVALVPTTARPSSSGDALMSPDIGGPISESATPFNGGVWS